MTTILFAIMVVANFAFADEVNLLKNPGFESRTSQWTKTGSSTFTIESSAPLEGTYSAKWDASATGEFFRSSTYTIPAGLKGTTCLIEMKYSWDSGTSGHIVMNVDDGTNNVATLSLEPTAAGVPRKAQLNFTCPSSGTVRFELESTANAAEIMVDSSFLGSGRNSAQLSQSELTAYAYFLGTANCTWQITSGSLGDFATDADCPAITVVSSTQTVDATDTNLPQIVFPNLRPGKYTVRVSLPLKQDVAEIHTKYIQVSDGTTHGPVCMNTHPTTTAGADETVWIVCDATFTYTTSGARTFKLRGAENATSMTIQNQGSQETRFEVRRDPIQGAEAITVETSGWRVDANISGANPDLGTSDQASYIGIENASLTLTNNTGLGLINAQIPCSSTNPPTGTTCAAGNESVGVSFSVPYAGDVRACASFGHHAALNTSGVIDATFQLVETASNAQTILQQGKSRITSGGQGNATSNYIPLQVCGTFTFDSAGQKTLRLMYEQDITATITTNLIVADAAGGSGQRDIHWEVYPINQQMPAPVFTEVRNKVNTGTSGVKMMATSIAGPSAGTCLVNSEPTGEWITGTPVAPGTGQCTLLVGAGVFSAAPSCTCTTRTNGRTCSLTAISTSSISTRTVLGTSGADDNTAIDVICVGLQ